jgi:hypothetical protein
MNKGLILFSARNSLIIAAINLLPLFERKNFGNPGFAPTSARTSLTCLTLDLILAG